jgi:hypothetical protein
MAMRWTDHLQPFASASDTTETSEAWYTENGITPFFTSITASGSGVSIQDTFLYYPVSVTGYNLSFKCVHGGSANYAGYVGTFAVKENTASKISNSYIISQVTSSTDKINYATWKKGNVNILRISRSNDVRVSQMCFMINNAVQNVEGDDVVVRMYVDPTHEQYDYGGTFVVAVDGVSAIKYKQTSSTSTAAVTNMASASTCKLITDLNYGFCDSYIIRPLIIMGVKTDLYTIDGGRDFIGNNTEFTLDGANWFHMGCGICVKL